MKKDDKDVIERLNELEIKQGIEEGISKWKKTVCITSTTAAGSFIYWTGSFLYHQFPAVKAAAIAFIQAYRGQPL